MSDDPKPEIVAPGPDLEKPTASSLLLEAHMMAFSGPLPHPSVLEHYNKIHPGAAERIIRMAELQGEHRRHLEKVTIEANAFTQKLGPILGFILAMTAVLGGIWLISKGLKAEGLTSVLVPLASLVGVFIYGKHRQYKELESKRDEREQPSRKSSKRRSK